jgi:putative FmdB family regulatory protein
MPSFEYFCKDCKKIFEELLLQPGDAKKYEKQHPCKCGRIAERVLSKSNFAFKAPSGPTQGSGVHGQSGVHDLDYPALDKAVGRSADTKWGVYHERKAVRDKARAKFGTNAVKQVRDKITPLTKDQLAARESGMKMHLKVADQIKKDSR